MEPESVKQAPPLQDNPPPSPQEPSGKRFPVMLIVLIVLVLIIGLLGGYILFGRSTSKTSVPTSQPTPTTATATIPTPTSEPTANWESYTQTKLNDSGFKSFTVQFPPGWTTKLEKTEVTQTITISKGDYAINAYQAPVGGAGCIFEGEVPEGPMNDLRNTKYVEIASDIATFRRYLRENSEVMEFCATTNGTSYGIPTNIGALTYTLPKNYGEKTLLEMDSILATLKEAQ